jgi:hypothetical protein
MLALGTSFIIVPTISFEVIAGYDILNSDELKAFLIGAGFHLHIGEGKGMTTKTD